MTYKPFRDLVLVKKIDEVQTAGGIILPEKQSGRFVKLEVIEKGPLVKEDIQPGDVILAEPMFERLDKSTSLGLILAQYIVAICDGKN